jgi:hypothetical protein
MVYASDNSGHGRDQSKDRNKKNVEFQLAIARRPGDLGQPEAQESDALAELPMPSMADRA